MLKAMGYSFPKSERLCSKVALAELFQSGEAMLVYPIRCVYRISGVTAQVEIEPLQVMVSVPKRNHKRAVHRNLLKRRTREAYRLNCHKLKEIIGLRGVEVDMALTYIAREVRDYKTIENAVRKIFTQLTDRLADAAD